MHVSIFIAIVLVAFIAGFVLGLFFIIDRNNKARDLYLMLMEDMEDYGDIIEEKNPILYKAGKNILDFANTMRNNQYGRYDSYNNVILNNRETILRIHEDFAIIEDNKDLVNAI